MIRPVVLWKALRKIEFQHIKKEKERRCLTDILKVNDGHQGMCVQHKQLWVLEKYKISSTAKYVLLCKLSHDCICNRDIVLTTNWLDVWLYTCKTCHLMIGLLGFSSTSFQCLNPGLYVFDWFHPKYILPIGSPLPIRS